MRYCYLIVLLICTHLLVAQHQPVINNDWKQVYLQEAADSLYLDSLTLVPASLQVIRQATALDSSQYVYDVSTGYLKFHHTLDSLTIRYRVLPFSLHAVHQHKSLVLYDSNAFFNDIRYASLQQEKRWEKETLFASPKLVKTGSISRGISVGNRQSVFVNSALNLQMTGALTDDINIRAAITDQNIPVQPEGNTQQLQNFDNVFIELYNDHVSLTAGDIILQQSGGSPNRTVRNTENKIETTGNDAVNEPYFMRFQRNVQGGQLKVNHAGSGLAQTDLGIALSKGRFASVYLDIQEGIQGPYRLKSPENKQDQAVSGAAIQQLGEAYYILANSEKVYLDGRLLKRGYDEDYTIDYNLGEITFTTNVMLTRNSRVNVDFGYADRSYSRRIITAGHEQRWERVQIYTRYFQEKDNRNQTLGFTLTDDDKLLLSEAGDKRSAAFISTVDSVGKQDPYNFDYQNNYGADVPGVGNLYQVRYNKVDTLVDGRSLVAYVFATDGGFDIDFTYVGPGQGDYEMNASSVNGKVFVWMAPVNGQSQGAYAPVRQLSTPQNRQLLTAGVAFEVTKKDKIFSEAALSAYDKNTFSPTGDADNLGKALTLAYESAPRKINWPGAHWRNAYQWTTQLRYEYVQQHFTTIDPYRDIEFERNWSVMPASLDTSDAAKAGDDHLLYFRAGLKKDTWNRMAYQITYRYRPDMLQGHQQRITMAKAVGQWKFSGQYFYLNSNMHNTNSDWNKLDVDVHYDRLKIVPGYRFRIDKNQVRQAGTDSVTHSLNNYSDHQWYLRSGDSAKSTFQLDYTYQTNYQPLTGYLTKSDDNQTIGATGNFFLSDRQILKVSMAYRHNNLNKELVKLTNPSVQESTVMGMIDWEGALWKDMLRMDLNYSLANGREIKREFVYVRVPIGEGTYTWRDDNGNTIEEIEEFYEARYWDEKNYARVYIATNQYVLAYTNQLNWQMNLQFPARWLESKGLKSLIARFSNSTFWNIDHKTANKDLYQRLNPWALIAEEDLLYQRNVLRSTLFFNRQSTYVGADLGMRMQKRKQLLNTGFEERNLHALLLNTRWNPNRSVGFQMAVENSRDEHHLSLSVKPSQARSYDIVSHRVSPEINWQPNMQLRISTRYGFNNKDNTQVATEHEKGEHALIHTAGWDVRYNRLMSNSMSASAEYINIQYNGDIKSPLSYVMLNALQPGDNVRWTFGWQQKLWNGLQLTTNYQGRKSPGQRAIHTGNVMLRALF